MVVEIRTVSVCVPCVCVCVRVWISGTSYQEQKGGGAIKLMVCCRVVNYNFPPPPFFLKIFICSLIVCVCVCVCVTTPNHLLHTQFCPFQLHHLPSRILPESLPSHKIFWMMWWRCVFMCMCVCMYTSAHAHVVFVYMCESVDAVKTPVYAYLCRERERDRQSQRNWVRKYMSWWVRRVYTYLHVFVFMSVGQCVFVCLCVTFLHYKVCIHWLSWQKFSNSLQHAQCWLIEFTVWGYIFKTCRHWHAQPLKYTTNTRVHTFQVLQKVHFISTCTILLKRYTVLSFKNATPTSFKILVFQMEICCPQWHLQPDVLKWLDHFDFKEILSCGWPQSSQTVL